MFTTQQVVSVLLVGLTVGATAGMVVYEVFRTDVERRRRILAERRVRELTVRLSAATDRADANAYLMALIARNVDDTHLGSRRAPQLRSVKP